jgi:hypothetical protein
MEGVTEIIIGSPCIKPSTFVCHGPDHYDRDHYCCKPCRFNSEAPYKKEIKNGKEKGEKKG